MRLTFRVFLSIVAIVVFVIALFMFFQVRQGQTNLREIALHGLIQVAVIVAAVFLLLHWIVTAPLRRTADWIRRLRHAAESGDSPPLQKELFGPLVQEVMRMARSLTDARTAAETEARLRESAASLWTPERLKEHARKKLQNRPIVVVSNREPYSHARRDKKIEVTQPASGLVTAIEPILLACGGTWIAHGSGDADRETVDERDHVRVPPEASRYTLRRVWLTPEEEAGYYYGFSNEGLWPLCHIAHTRPTFRSDDWAAYHRANEKFADAVVEELAGNDDPLVLVQDYHFALLPRMIKERRPDARVALFWHIPWPNPESFGICPWQRELLDGMLGADLLGFHIQYHCNNFLDTVDRALECRIDRERFSVRRQNHTTQVKPFPISVAFPTKPPDALPSVDATALLARHGLKGTRIAVGVDRLDYTKGILERFLGLERLFETNPDYRGDLTLVQIGAPSRTRIARYQDIITEVNAEAGRINARFGTRDWKPILLLQKHHTHADIQPYYRAASVCLVTSLHDGMNLVAKEFVAARDDEDGALILSRFTGAARELSDALIINPYDVDQTAQAIRAALEMSPEERRARMRRMRAQVRENNIFRWAANLIAELTDIRRPPHGDGPSEIAWKEPADLEEVSR